MLFKIATLLFATYSPVVSCGTTQDGFFAEQPQFSVECQFISTDGDITNAPKITVFEGQNASIADQTQTPFVTDVINRGGAVQPVVEVINEGMEIKLNARLTTEGKILLRVNAELAEIADVHEAQLAAGTRLADGELPMLQFPQRNAQSISAGRTLESGDTTELEFADGTRVKLTVNRVK